MEQTVLYTNLTAKSFLKLIIRISCAENDKYVVILNSLNIYIYIYKTMKSIYYSEYL